MKRIFQYIIVACIPFVLSAQSNVGYLGGGNNIGFSVTSSSDLAGTSAENTVNGSGLDAPLMEASRFLSHATLGHNMSDIQALVDNDLDFNSWIEDQFAVEGFSTNDRMELIWEEIKQEYFAAGFTEDDLFGPYSLHFHYAWYHSILNNEDVLRHKIAYALSQILVVSGRSGLGDYGESLSSYYDVLLNHSFGNYKDLLQEVTLHPSMGFYLTHLNNPKEIPEFNIHPDENYAREIMQLFSIGLYELNIDGTRRLDSSGNPLSTYDNTDIKELAKVFTGLGGGALEEWVFWTTEPYFGLEIFAIDKSVPMRMFEEWHQQGTKTILKNDIIPAGQSGMQDIEQAVDILFNHPNVGPFLARRMIQRLVKSNPSPEYIARVAAAFNDNGAGVRGDMKAFVKAILLDEEARECAYLQEESSSRMREPLMRYTAVLKGFPLDNPLDRFWNNGFQILDAVKQMALQSPSVFNFYLPDFQPVGDISNNDLVAPEFKIHHTTSSIGYINLVNAWTIWNNAWYSWEGGNIPDEPVSLDTDGLLYMASEPDRIIRELDIVFSHGQLTDETRDLIRAQVSALTNNGDADWERIRLAMFIFFISPDFVIMR